jgi:hypothetical protein
MPVSAVKVSSSGAINSSDLPEYRVIDPASPAALLEPVGVEAVSLAQPDRRIEKLRTERVNKRRGNADS